MKRKTVGQRLKEIMDKRGLKQVDIIEASKPFFTDKVKISKTDLSQYVNDKAEPRSDKLYILAKGLNVPEQWLLGFDDDDSTTPTPKTADLADEDVIFTYEGKKIPPEDLEYMKRILRGGKA